MNNISITRIESGKWVALVTTTRSGQEETHHAIGSLEWITEWALEQAVGFKAFVEIGDDDDVTT